jgi:hypothetical protein
VAEEGDRAKARNEFDTLVGYFSGFEARARYAEVLDGWGESEAAMRLREGIAATGAAASRPFPAHEPGMAAPPGTHRRTVTSVRPGA